MKEILFYFFVALTLVPAFFVATSRNAVNAAMNMMLSFVGLGALFVFLETYFLAVLQVMVYAGAIVVLFLFIIMLIDPDQSPKPSWLKLLASLIALALLITGSYGLVYGGGAGPLAEISVLAPAAQAKSFGYGLFTQYMLPFQITGFMLLMAMIGVIVISKKVPVEQGGSAK